MGRSPYHEATLRTGNQVKDRTADSVDYMLGDGAGELHRLGIQHRVWAEVTYASWRRAGFAVGDTIMDLGCGPGFTSLDLAQRVGPTGLVIAVDQSAEFLAELSRQAKLGGQSVRTELADVASLEWEFESLDGAYARWLFCFLDNPGAVVYNVATALKPAARLVTLDYFNYEALTLAPRSMAMEEVVEAIQLDWRQRGGDLDVQGEMPGLMAECGLEVVEVRQVSGIARPGSLRWRWLEAFLVNHLPKLVAAEQLDLGVVDEFWQDWGAAAAQAASYLYLPPLLEIHGRKPAA